MTISSHQPHFFPWMGYFYKMFKSDVFVYSDDVQFSKRNFQNYNFIITPEGRKQRITLPITYHASPINEIKIAASEKNIDDLVNTIYFCYHKAPFYSLIWGDLEAILRTPYNSLSDINIALTQHMADSFGLECRRYLSSELGLKKHKDERIIEMCEMFEADRYYSGTGAAVYHDPEKYAEHGITLEYSDYVPVTYPQGKWTFVPCLSSLDYIMNCGYNLPQEWRGI